LINSDFLSQFLGDSIKNIRHTDQADSSYSGGIYAVHGIDSNYWDTDDGVMIVARNFRTKICERYPAVARKADTWSNWEVFEGVNYKYYDIEPN